MVEERAIQCVESEIAERSGRTARPTNNTRPDEEYFYFLQPMRSVERSVGEVVGGDGPYISRQIVAMSARRCSSVRGSTSCRVSLITTLESISGCASAF